VIKAGLLGAVVGFVYVMSLTLISPFCTLCITPLLGFGVGYLAGWFDTPEKSEASLYRGSVAGGITGFGVVVGQMLATVVNAILVTNWEQLPELAQSFGLSEFMMTDGDQYWQITLTTNSVCSLFNLLIIAGLGAIGGLIWFQRQDKRPLSTASA
jgi:MFS family permease